MTTTNPKVRRANIEDLPQLVPLWQAEGLGDAELEKRFKEFQVVEMPGTGIVAALGLHVSGVEARLHSEVFAQPELSDAMRELLWQRAQVVAQNHGVIRLWTQLATPFWNHNGFRRAAGELLVKLPGAFGGDSRPWQFLQLREEAAAPVSIEKEFALFREMEKERTEKMFRQARLLKIIAAVVVVAVFALIIFWLLAWFRTRGQLPR